MKNAFMIFNLLMVVFCATGQPGTDIIVFDNYLHDFGLIYKGSDAEHVFSFLNKSKSEVAITNVSTSCGCALAAWTKKPVNTGGKGEIKVKYNTNTTGSFVKTISVLTTLNDKPIILTIRGEVQKKQKRKGKIL